MNILFATWNEKKLIWLKEGFQSLGLQMMPLSRDDISEVEEDGASCEENALKKSNAIGIRKDTIIISEDSGLFIDALNGFPGTHTARWAPGTDDDRAELLIRRMVEIEERNAQFLSCVSLLFPTGEQVICLGRMDGIISKNPRGANGSGYDAVFQLSSGLTIAETGRDAVEPFDHRRNAMAKAVERITECLSEM